MSTQVKVSEEKQFMYRDSFNKGHIQTPSMVENCIGLSNNAKTVYSNILNHIYEKGHSAFPSTYRLAISCSCSTNSVVSYIQELVDKGFIIKQPRGRGRSNHYYVRDCSEVPLLKVSEMFWKSMSSLTNLYGWKKVQPAKDTITNFMDKVGYRLQDMETDEESSKQLTDSLMCVLKGGKLDVGLLPKNMKFQKPSAVEHQTQPSEVEEVKKQVKRKTVSATSGICTVSKNHWSQKPVNEWGAEQFKEYYYHTYLDSTGQPHPINMKKHTGMLRRIVKSMEGKNELLRGYIDTLFKIGYDNVTLDYFSANRIGEIQTFLTSGKKPFYLEKKEPKFRDVQSGLLERSNISSDELMKKMLGGEQ